MKYFYILLILRFIGILSGECGRYKPVSNIKECLIQDPIASHQGCCGVSIKGPLNIKRDFCLDVPNTKAGKDFYKKIQQLSAKVSNSTLEMICPEQDDKIKGTCQEFTGLMVDDPKECTKLKAKGRKSCCGLKARGTYNEYGVSLDMPLYTCLELPPTKELRESTVEDMKKFNHEYYAIVGYVC